MSLFSFSLRGRSLAALLVLAATSSAQAPADRGPEPGSPDDYMRIPEPAKAEAVRVALRGASEYLQRPECEKVFSDFADPGGRPLRDILAAQAKTGPAFLQSLIFYDGAHHPLCRLKQTYAVAHPGSRVVFVCTAQFQRIALKKPRVARAVLIHEALHALGLGENPPPSAEITHRVLNRCLP